MAILKLRVDLPLQLFEEERLALLDSVANSSNGTTASFVVTASNVALSSVSLSSSVAVAPFPTPPLAAFFLSPTLTDSVIQKNQQKQPNVQLKATAATAATAILTNDAAARNKSIFFVYDDAMTRQLSRRLLTLVHPFLAENFSIRGIISVQNPTGHCPADIVLLDLSHAPDDAVVEHLLQITNGQTIYSGPEAILKTLVLSHVSFEWERDEDHHLNQKMAAVSTVATAAAASPAMIIRDEYDLPTCPVCLHRINPHRIGLPSPSTRQVCSKFCPAPNLALWSSSNLSGTGGTEQSCSCPQQRLLRPWPSPCHCKACSVIEKYWKDQIHANGYGHDPFQHQQRKQRGGGGHDDAAGCDELRCFRCGLKETLWVCLTCSIIGCGRYSNRHSVEHFDETGHPFSLELATLRIWDYTSQDFSHRPDLLDCPSSPPLLYPWIQRQRIQYDYARGKPQPLSFGAATSVDMEMKSPKKAFMISEEYEALLQSALEDQAQHYEGEITSLRARLTEDNLDQRTMTPHDAEEIQMVRAEIASLRAEIEEVSRELVEYQALEAQHRATSQSLLREQQVAQGILQSIQEETAAERELGKSQVEELEQQIADLTANQTMRLQFCQDEELARAHIWGMSSDSSSAGKSGGNKKGKKARRGFRK